MQPRRGNGELRARCTGWLGCRLLHERPLVTWAAADFVNLVGGVGFLGGLHEPVTWSMLSCARLGAAVE